MQTRRTTKLEKEAVVITDVKQSMFCIQLKEVLSNSWQGFFEGLEFETVTLEEKAVTIMRGTFENQAQFQKILQQLEEMNLHYQKVTLDTTESQIKHPDNYSWIHT